MITDGVIPSLSTTQAESFDPNAKAGCPRRWWFERVKGIKAPTSAAKEEGDAGHALLAAYLTTGQGPEGRVKMGKAVTGAIAKGELPAPGPDLLIERRFDGGAHRVDEEGKWIPFDPQKTLWLGGVPWDGFVDLRFRRDDAVDVMDHKFSSDIHANALPADSLIKTVQMPVYCLDSLRIWPDATRFRLHHHNVSRKGVDSFIRTQVVTLDQVLERKAEIEGLVGQMQQVARVESQDDVPFNKKACDAYGGCHLQSVCTAFKERNKVNLTAEELALFDDLDGVSAAPAKPEPVNVGPLPDLAEALAEVKAEPYKPSPEELAEVRAKWEEQSIPQTTPDTDTLPAPTSKRKRKIKIEEADPAGWTMVTCSKCGTELGKRPPGSSISPLLCPNKENHGAATPAPVTPVTASTPAPAPAIESVTVGAPVPMTVTDVQIPDSVRTVLAGPGAALSVSWPPAQRIELELGPRTIALLADLLKR